MNSTITYLVQFKSSFTVYLFCLFDYQSNVYFKAGHRHATDFKCHINFYIGIKDFTGGIANNTIWHTPSEQVIKFWLFTTEGFIVRTYSNTVHKSSAGAEAGRRTESDSEIEEKYVVAVLFNRCQGIIWSERSVWNIQYTYSMTITRSAQFPYWNILNIWNIWTYFSLSITFFVRRCCSLLPEFFVPILRTKYCPYIQVCAARFHTCSVRENFRGSGWWPFRRGDVETDAVIGYYFSSCALLFHHSPLFHYSHSSEPSEQSIT